MDQTSRNNDPQYLHGAFRSALFDKLLPLLAKEGLPLRVYEGARTPFRQAELYARGRVAGHGDLGKHVTFSLAWHSMHQFGLAADMVFFVNGGWSWDEPQDHKGAWKRYQQLAAQCGLEPVRKKDGSILEWPHVQLPSNLVKLRAGEYPPGGDEQWAWFLNQQIDAWGGEPKTFWAQQHPAAPPRAIVGPERPHLED